MFTWIKWLFARSPEEQFPSCPRCQAWMHADEVICPQCGHGFKTVRTEEGFISTLCPHGLPVWREAHEGKIILYRAVLDGTGENRLVLKYLELPLPGEPMRAYDFLSLFWLVRDGEQWTEKAAITKAEFQNEAEPRRWVNDLRSLDPAKGHAVIQVGEEQAPGPGGCWRLATAGANGT